MARGLRSGLVRPLEVAALTSVFVAAAGVPAPALADPAPQPPPPAPEDRWPLAYLQRPMTLLGDMMEAGVAAATFAPNNRFNVDPTNGGTYQFFPAFFLGLSLGYGFSDRLEIDLSVPRVVCADGGNEPSSCIPVNRYNETAGTLTYAFLRDSRWQGAVTTALEVYRSSPLEVEWGGGVAFKLVPWRVLGIWLEADVWRDLNPPATQTSQLTSGVANLGLDLQVTEQLLLKAHVVPWAPLDSVNDGGPALEIYGVASYTFNHSGQLSLEGGSNNVLANPAWNRSVPGWYTRLTLLYWTY